MAPGLLAGSDGSIIIAQNGPGYSVAITSERERAGEDTPAWDDIGVSLVPGCGIIVLF